MDDEQDNEHQMFLLDSLTYLESLSRRYGAEKAHDVWQALGPAIGKDVQLDVFAMMLTGEAGGGRRISFRVTNASVNGSGPISNTIPTIKLIRAFTGVGLKEAKDLWDHAKDTNQWTILHGPQNVTAQERHQTARDLRSMGHEVR